MSQTFTRKILNATVTLARAEGAPVVQVSVHTTLFRRTWDVPLLDARWVRDRLFEILV